MPDLTSSPLINTLEHYLTLTTASQQRTTSNMANVDTPGYHTRDINFQAEMHRAMSLDTENASIEDSATENTGMQSVFFQNAAFGGQGGLSPVVREVKGLLERPDGNNVSLDREGMTLSQTQLQFQLGEQLVKHEFHGILSAISGGS